MAVDMLPLAGKLAVLYGGESSERDVSLESGAAVMNALQAAGYEPVAIDVKTSELESVLVQQKIKHCFIALHGGAGENGQVQAILKTLGITYTGSDMMGCAIAMDKQRTKLLWKGAGIQPAPRQGRLFPMRSPRTAFHRNVVIVFPEGHP